MTSASSPDSSLEDDILPRALGRYQLLSMLARGGMGEVYLASTMGLEGAERPVVVKVIRREHASDPSFYARFLDEARVQAQLQHSGVAQIIEAAMQPSGEPYVVVEHVEGRSLGEVRARARECGTRLTWADAVAITMLIAEALAHVHERSDSSGKPLSIVHRDLSPQNVMLAYAGEVKLIDFGTARGQNRKCHTVAGVVFAKPGYVAPEVANGDPGDARVDVYALGIMLWELCVGRRFLQGDPAEHLARVAKDCNNPPPIAASVKAPATLDDVIAKLTAFDRSERYLAARAVTTDLAALLGHAPPLPSGERGVRARVAALMNKLFPGEPMHQRREFARLLEAARAALPELSPSTPPPAPTPGAVVFHAEEDGVLAGTRYRLRQEIGRGESSIVYEAEHIDLGRRVALKVLAREHAGSKEHVARFRREGRALSHLVHPSLVRLDDFGVAEGGRFYCVMELCEGEALDVYLEREGPLDFRDALSFADQALSALEVVHEAGIVHRDVKPANLFLGDNGRLRLLDFGMAKTDLPEDADSNDGLSLFGTPEYMAPEQAAQGRVDGRADIYAVGCMLYEMLTGRLPFAQSSAVAIIDAKTKGSPESPRARAAARGIPKSVDALVMRAMARHPSVRFQTAGEMRAAIRSALDEPARRRRRGRRMGLVGLVAASIVGAFVIQAKVPALRAMVPSALMAPLTMFDGPPRPAPVVVYVSPPAPAATTTPQQAQTEEPTMVGAPAAAATAVTSAIHAEEAALETAPASEEAMAEEAPKRATRAERKSNRARQRATKDAPTRPKK